MLDLATYLPKLKEFEGCSPHMYLDTAGNVTVGVGQMLHSSAIAQTLPFATADGTPATADEIAAGFAAVKACPTGMLYPAYRKYTSFDLPDSEIDKLTERTVAEVVNQIRVNFPDYDSYPGPACAAIFDMAYNLGLSGLEAKFPLCCEAIREQDWATAAEECERLGIQKSRNDWTEAQFAEAATTTT